jgi:hypothetical protein
MKSFWVADLTAAGELRDKLAYTHALLEHIPGAAELMGDLAGRLYAQPAGFDLSWRTAGGAVHFRWRASSPSATAGVATVRWDEQLASVSLLAAGQEPDADQIALKTFQQHLMAELRDTGYEPAFALLDLAERPLVVTVAFSPPPDVPRQRIVALADRCFAAALFRFLGLA